MINDASMPSRYFGFRIVLIQVYVRKYAAVRIPTPDIGLNTDDWKLFPNSSAALDYQARQGPRSIAILERCPVRIKVAGPLRRGKSVGLRRRRRYRMVSRVVRFESWPRSLIGVASSRIDIAYPGITTVAAVPSRHCRFRYAGGSSKRRRSRHLRIEGIRADSLVIDGAWRLIDWRSIAFARPRRW